jgi:beta-glucosidase
MVAQTFPDGFKWGCATASYQVEGACLADGAGESIWHRFAHTPGKIKGGDTGDTACDHYYRGGADVDWMRWLGLNAYRFSIAWPRLFPADARTFNAQGLAFYDRLVDSLLAAGIEPFVTLYHWDLPTWADDRGGWTNRDCASWFADYASAVYERLGDRVHQWMTLNEPWVSAFLGYLNGVHAPGHTDPNEAYAAAHNLLLAHGLGVQRFRQSGHDGKVGIALNMTDAIAATPSDADRQAARLLDGQANRWFADPIFRGTYPEDVEAVLAGAGVRLPEVAAGDMSLISAPIDFLGLNYYSVQTVTASTDLGGFRVQPPADRTLNAMGWEMEPSGLYHLLTRLHREYTQGPIYITENGYPLRDAEVGGSDVDDQPRIDYLRDHIGVAWQALQDGVPLKGYFLWSLMDNFEWAEGYSARFGILRVNFETQERTPKRSAEWYRQVIARNGLA